MKIDGVELESMTHDGVEVQTWIHDGVEVYSAGRLVTYHVDTDMKYVEKIKKGLSALSPTTFTPSKDGWSFVGWREDTTASGDVLSEKVVEKSAITLYAVFSQNVTLSYSGNGSTGGSTAAQTGTRYYNNGVIENATLVLSNSGFSKTYYAFAKWAVGSTSGTQYSAGDSVTISANTTVYAIWTQTKCTSSVVMNGIDCYDRTWELMSIKSLANTPSNNTFFTLSGDRTYITVNKACTVNMYMECSVGGGGGSVAFTDASSGQYGAIGVGDEQDVCSGTVTRSFSAGSRIYVRVYNYSASGDGDIVFRVSWMNITLTATA